MDPPDCPRDSKTSPAPSTTPTTATTESRHEWGTTEWEPQTNVISQDVQSIRTNPTPTKVDFWSCMKNNSNVRASSHSFPASCRSISSTKSADSSIPNPTAWNLSHNSSKSNSRTDATISKSSFTLNKNAAIFRPSVSLGPQPQLSTQSTKKASETASQQAIVTHILKRDRCDNNDHDSTLHRWSSLKPNEASPVSRMATKKSNFPTLTTAMLDPHQPRHKESYVSKKGNRIVDIAMQSQHQQEKSLTKKKTAKNCKPLSSPPPLHPNQNNINVLQHNTVDTSHPAIADASFDLVRQFQNYQDRGGIIPSKGLQRLKPRKKKFTSLKKKVLEERLRQWKEHQSANQIEGDTTTTPTTTDSTAQTVPYTTVQILGYCDENDSFDNVDDDEEYQELVDNLYELAEKVGSVRRIYIPRQIGIGAVFVEFDDTTSAETAVVCWNKLILGGQSLHCQPLLKSLPAETTRTSVDDTPTSSLLNLDEEWQQWCLMMSAQNAAVETDVHNGDDKDVTLLHGEKQTKHIILLENALTEDDIEDEECLQESLSDIRILASKFGTVVSIEADVDATTSCVRIVYSDDITMIEKIVSSLCKIVIGGQQIIARLSSLTESGCRRHGESLNDVLLHNVLTDDDVEDNDCLEESLNDIQELAEQFGKVLSVSLASGKPQVGRDNPIRVVFETVDEAKCGATGLNGMVVGGQVVTACHSADHDSANRSGTIDSCIATNSVEKQAMYSGDKLISERFAECKRAPKVNNPQEKRPYATHISDESVKVLLIEMLGELMRLQSRSANDKNAKARRRVVMGLREVARGIRSHKVKLLVMANNLDEYGALDDKVQEIIDLAHAGDVPVFFDFTKRSLGKALGKSIKVAVAGVQNAEGAHQQFKKLTKIASNVL